MNLPIDLVKRFSKVMKNQNGKTPTTVNATVTKEDESGTLYVQFDGADTETPVEVVVDAEVGDRVAVEINNHKGKIVKNYTAPPSSRKASKYVKMTEDGLLIGDLFGIEGSAVLVGSDKISIYDVDGNESFAITLSRSQYVDGTVKYGFRIRAGQTGSFISVRPESSSSNYLEMSSSMTRYINHISSKATGEGYTETTKDYAYHVYPDDNDYLGYYVDWNGDMACNSFASGKINVSDVAAGSAVIGSGTFDHEFTAVPVVVAGFSSNPTGSPVSDFGKCTVTVYDVTKTGFKYKVCNGGSSARSPQISWMAIRPSII